MTNKANEKETKGGEEKSKAHANDKEGEANKSENQRI